jgi:hypothetical protein
MSTASRRADARADTTAESRSERLQHWIAALSSALLHLLLLLLAMRSPPITVSTAEGAEAGSRMAVQFVGQTPPPLSAAATSKPAASRPLAKRIQSTLVDHSEDPLPPEIQAEAAQGAAPVPSQRPPAAPTPPAPPRRPQQWGQPPGLLQEDLAPVNAGLARSSGTQRGRSHDASASGPNMDVGGYQVYYRLRSETRLRAWRDQGMTELFLPLPGTRRYMICPLETALKQESGPCRLLEPDSPELANIGDAREVIDMQKVFRQGEVVWSGPGPYK